MASEGRAKHFTMLNEQGKDNTLRQMDTHVHKAKRRRSSAWNKSAGGLQGVAKEFRAKLDEFNHAVRHLPCKRQGRMQRLSEHASTSYGRPFLTLPRIQGHAKQALCEPCRSTWRQKQTRLLTWSGRCPPSHPRWKNASPMLTTKSKTCNEHASHCSFFTFGNLSLLLRMC